MLVRAVPDSQPHAGARARAHNSRSPAHLAHCCLPTDSADAPEKFEYPINRYAMETKRQLDVLDKQLAKHTYITGSQFTLADCAIWPWYGALVLGRLYNAADFLDVHSYTHVVRWAKLCEQREAVRKGRMVNRSTPDRSALYGGLPALPERHGRGDWVQQGV